MPSAHQEAAACAMGDSFPLFRHGLAAQLGWAGFVWAGEIEPRATVHLFFLYSVYSIQISNLF
jgi:hypothetical protein